eukprot:scaffold1135_cov216-Pinguiococcus_pyrenoidosus.AAC.2
MLQQQGNPPKYRWRFRPSWLWRAECPARRCNLRAPLSPPPTAFAGASPRAANLALWRHCTAADATAGLFSPATESAAQSCTSSAAPAARLLESGVAWRRDSAAKLLLCRRCPEYPYWGAGQNVLTTPETDGDAASFLLWNGVIAKCCVTESCSGGYVIVV